MQVNDGKMGWMVAVVTLGVSFSGGIVGWGQNYGQLEQRLISMEQWRVEINKVRDDRGEVLAKHSAILLAYEQRMSSAERQLLLVNALDARLARIEVVVEIVARQLGAPIPQRSPSVP